MHECTELCQVINSTKRHENLSCPRSREVWCTLEISWNNWQIQCLTAYGWVITLNSSEIHTFVYPGFVVYLLDLIFFIAFSGYIIFWSYHLPVLFEITVVAFSVIPSSGTHRKQKQYDQE
jgi:hypothetical protein